MHRRILFAAITACLAGGMTLAGASTAAAAPATTPAARPLPIHTGPGGAVRTPAAAQPRVIGGKPVANGQFPFQAALLAQSFGNTDFQRQYCGGSLITPTQVLTAAHCVDFVGPGAGQVPRSDLRVVVGRTVLSSTQGQKRQVASFRIHPLYNPDLLSHDVAIITLASPVTGIRPISVVTPGTDALERPGTMLTVSGWGNTIAQPAGPGGGGTNFPDRMQSATVPVVGRAECATAYATADLTIDATQLCAGRTNLDTCQGDSGGPLFVKAVGAPGFIQVGITSWGIGCGATGFPGVYTRLGNRSVGNFVLNQTGGAPV
jgi:secreted trypsin-like serine protease